MLKTTCCESYLGAKCPVCDIPAPVKDAAVDKQLLTLALLCQRLRDALGTEGYCNSGGDHDIQCTPNQSIPGSKSCDISTTLSASNNTDVESSRFVNVSSTKRRKINGDGKNTDLESSRIINVSSTKRRKKNGDSKNTDVGGSGGLGEVCTTKTRQKNSESMRKITNGAESEIKEQKQGRKKTKGKNVPKSEKSEPKSDTKVPKSEKRKHASPIKRRMSVPNNESSEKKHKVLPNTTRRESLPADQSTMTKFYTYDDDDENDINSTSCDIHLENSPKASRMAAKMKAKKETKKNTVSASKKTRLRHILDSERPGKKPSEDDDTTSEEDKTELKHASRKKTIQTVQTDSNTKKKTTKQTSAVKSYSENEIPNKSTVAMTTPQPMRVSGYGRNSPVFTKNRRRKDVTPSTPTNRISTRTKATVVQSPALDKRNAKGETPLQVAAIKNDVARVRELLQQGANPNVRDNAGWTPLHEACNHGYVEIAKLLLDNGAMICVPGLDNDTALHDAINNNRVECVRLLVSRGASLSLRNIHGETPIDLARTDIIKVALQTPVVTNTTIVNSQPIDPVEYQAPCLLGTGLSREDKVQLQKAASQLHVKLVDDVTPEVTHIVTKCNSEGQCPRTIKIIQGILAGKWILNMEWLETCAQLSSLVCEEAFEVQGTSLFPNSLAPSLGRINRKQQLPGLFDGCKFYFHGSFEYAQPSKEDLTHIINVGGGTILSREPKPGHLDGMVLTVPYHADVVGELAHCCIYVVHEKETDMSSIRTRTVCSVPSSWIMDCASNFKLVSLPHV